MTIQPLKKNHSFRARIALVPALSLSLLGASIAVAAPANANDDRDRDHRYGCTVKPLDPKDLRGNKVDFRIKVECDDKNFKRTVHIRQLRYEDEKGPRRTDDFLGRSHFYEVYKKGEDGKRTIHSIDKVPNLDRRGAEEVYHLVSFRVQKGDGHWSDWSEWKESDVVEVRVRH